MRVLASPSTDVRLIYFFLLSWAGGACEAHPCWTAYDPVTADAGANSNAVVGQALALNATPGGGVVGFTYTWAINSGTISPTALKSAARNSETPEVPFRDLRRSYTV